MIRSASGFIGVSTNGTSRVARNGQTLFLLRQRIPHPQGAGLVTQAQQQLDRGQRLSCAHRAHHRPQDASVFATLLCLTTGRVQAGIAGTGATGVEHRKLAFEADRSTRYQRPACLHAGAIDGEAGGDIVASVEEIAISLMLSEIETNVRSIWDVIKRSGRKFGPGSKQFME